MVKFKLRTTAGTEHECAVEQAQTFKEVLTGLGLPGWFEAKPGLMVSTMNLESIELLSESPIKVVGAGVGPGTVRPLIRPPG